jgi:Holliday junction resolvasome RuvABC endonuclease subunit
VTPVLALDLATSTGWALRERNGVVTSGVQRFELGRGESPGMRWLRFRRWVREVIVLGRLSPGGLIACERPLAGRRGFTAGIAIELRTILQEEAAAQQLEVTDVAPATLKKHATGRGNAKKPDMQAAAAKRWGTNAAGELQEDQADALCVLGWALDEIGEAEVGGGS